jgi:polysaccharide biosynthesis protein PslH
MRVLQICNKVPFPALDGGSIVMHNTTLALLQKHCSVTVLAVTTPKNPVDIAAIPKSYRERVDLHIVEIDTRITKIGALKNLFSALPYHVSRYRSDAFLQKLIELVKAYDFDIIQFESLYLLIYVAQIRPHTRAKLVYRSQNVEHFIWQRITQQTRRGPLKYWLSLQTKRLKSFEFEQCQSIDLLIAITDIDKLGLSQLCNGKEVHPISLGIDLSQFVHREFDIRYQKRIFHLGSMDWYPNEEAIRWFLDAIWPKIREADAEIELHLAGKHMPAWVSTYQSSGNIFITGTVSDPIAYMSDKGLMLVPLLSGSGIRVKILEGMAIGKPIVSTSVGAEGINCTGGKHLMIGDSEEKFAEAIITLTNDSVLCKKLSAEARLLIEREYGLEPIGAQFLEVYRH